MKLTSEDIAQWKGKELYIPHLVVQNPESKSLPVRLCFNASRPQGKERIRLSDCLAKGPDNYINNLCGVLVHLQEMESYQWRILVQSHVKREDSSQTLQYNPMDGTVRGHIQVVIEGHSRIIITAGEADGVEGN